MTTLTHRKRAEEQDRGNPASPEPSTHAPHARPPTSWHNNSLFKLTRCMGVWAWILLSYPLLVVGVASRWLNPWLRSRGVPNGSMPSDMVQVLWASTILWLSGIRVIVEGKDKLKELQSRSSIMMANHASGLDPFILMGYSRVAPKYVFKRSLIYQFPPIFLLAWGYGHIPINRSNRESAINSLHNAAKKIQKFHRVIAIFPEGTRSKDGRLLPFKRGPFHLASEARAPIAPMYIEGAWELFSPSSFSFQPDAGTVRLRVLPLIENTDTDTVDTLETKVRQTMEKAQSERRAIPNSSSPLLSFIASVVFIILAVMEVRYLYSVF